ncbi:proton-coupled amino acid transporter-like protein pathetic isoform X2 [Toxorhynchites rutilus septentrionalis]|uniref:proton-coupled amino acid transporter-like protein pathetic isoform X2 n=1 Tax=Toxorhynchites rutilus septentrionalis TaxID=329112 RepID=UPI00247A8270|nr:proton-coupled amino acid transporter-like protein pathetic isoform X2 [Toxorhynchites rutilus septentrionalis]
MSPGQETLSKLDVAAGEIGPNICSEDVDYNPFENRQMRKANSSLGTLIHLIKGSLGTGILAMPVAFKNGGLAFGILGTALVAIIYTHCVHLLVGTSQKACKRSKIPLLGFSETAENVCANGPRGARKFATFAKAYIDYMLLVVSFFSVCVYLVFISTTLRDVLNHELGIDWSIRIYILLMAVLTAIITQVRELKYLVPFSLIANTSIFVVFVITLYYIFKEPVQFQGCHFWPELKTLPSFFGTVVYAIEGMGIVLPVENKMKHPQHFLHPFGVINIAISFISTMYIITGFFGYARYGPDTKGSVTLNLPNDEILAKSTQLLGAIAILFTIGLYYYVPMEILMRKLEHKIPPRKHNLAQVCFRLSIVVAMTILALTIPELEPFIGFVGSIGSATMGLMIPIVLDTIFRWPNNFGRMNWRLVKNAILGTFGLFILAVGTYFSMMDIVAIYV